MNFRQITQPLLDQYKSVLPTILAIRWRLFLHATYAKNPPDLVAQLELANAKIDAIRTI